MKSTSFILSIGLVLYFGDGGDENFGGFLKIILVLCGGELMWCFYLYILVPLGFLTLRNRFRFKNSS